MADNATTVKDTLFTNWALTGDLAASKIDFNIGKHAKARTYPSIEVLHDGAGVDTRTQGQDIIPERLVVDVWVRKADWSAATSDRDSCIKEVRRIIRANRKAMSGISYARTLNVVPIDEKDNGVARSRVFVECLYFES